MPTSSIKYAKTYSNPYATFQCHPLSTLPIQLGDVSILSVNWSLADRTDRSNKRTWLLAVINPLLGRYLYEVGDAGALFVCPESDYVH
jgi:hypothetical protein